MLAASLNTFTVLVSWMKMRISEKSFEAECRDEWREPGGAYQL